MLSGCGYRFEGCPSNEDPITLTIPYVPGDNDGLFTEELVRQFSSSGLFECVRDGGEYILKVAITKDTNTRIGFRYDQDDTTGALKKNIIPDEFRRSIVAEVTLVKSSTDEIVFGPETVIGSSEFDCVNPSAVTDLTFVNPLGVREKVIQFSLGQLDSVEGAQDNAGIPLYRGLAQSIVDGIINSL